MTQIILTSGTSWTVPSDWNSINNTVECIGGGGGGSGAYGGGGGGYSKIVNLALTPGAKVSYAIGAGGPWDLQTGNGTAGGDTWFSSTATLLAKGGAGGLADPAPGNPGAGGAASAGVGTTTYSGGAGGPAINSNYYTGGGGAAGPYGNGGAGGGGGVNYAAAGGGGGGGGTAGGVTSGPTGGTGGNNHLGSGGAGAANQNANGNAGQNGGGGGGGGAANNGTGPGTTGGNGGPGSEWAAGVGSGGGGGSGGGSTSTSGVGGNGGNYGGGGGSSGYPGSAAGGAGAPGVIVITYTAASNAPTGTLSATQAPQTIAAAATVAVSGALRAAQSAQTINAAGANGTAATGAPYGAAGSGTATTAPGSEIVLVTSTINGTFLFEPRLNNMAAGDVFEFRLYTVCLSGTAPELAWKATFGPQIPASIKPQSPPIASDQSIQVTVKQIAGSARAMDWKLLTDGSVGSSPPPPPPNAPAPPTNLAANSTTVSTVPLTWTASTTSGATYGVNYRPTGTTPWTNAASPVSGTSYTVTGLSAATSYDFEVIAVAGGQTSSPSNVVTATTVGVAPSAVSVTIDSTTASTVNAAWSAPSTGTPPFTYTPMIRQTGTTTWTYEAPQSGTTFTFTGLAASTQYDVQVQAANTNPQHSTSAIIVATTAAPVSGTPRVTAPLTGTVGTGSWTAHDISVSGVKLPSGKQVHFNVLLPAQYSTSVIYPVLLWLHPDTEGDPWYLGTNTDPTFLSTGDAVGNGTSADQMYNNVGFRTNYPAIIVLGYADQTSGGSDGNDAVENWGGWVNNGSTGSGTVASGDTGPNVFATLGVIQWVLANYSADPSRVYIEGFSLGGIGAEYLMLMYNQVNGNPALFTAAMSVAGTLAINDYGGPTSANVTTMTSVPAWWVSGGSDTASPPKMWNEPMWTALGGGNYPAPGSSASASRAGSSQYHYWEDPNIGHQGYDANGNPYPTNGIILSWLFAQIGSSGAVAPGPATNLTVGSITSSSVVLSWGAPATGTAPFSYQVRYRVSGTSTWSNGPSALGTSAPITGLSASTGYDFDVVTSNNGSSTSTSATVSATTSASTPPTQKRDWTVNPGMDGSFWVLPFQTTAKWTTSGAVLTTLRNGSYSGPTGHVHLPGDYSTPFIVGHSGDPMVTFTDGAQSVTVPVPAGTTAEAPFTQYDVNLGIIDSTTPYRIVTVGQCANLGPWKNGATVSVGFLQIDDGSGQIMTDAVTGQPGHGNAYGGIQDVELTAANADASYVIPHMLAYELDATQINTQVAWPLNVYDTSGGPSGNVPQGLTIGIPASTPRPAGQTRGFYLLFDSLQQFGWFFYNQSGNGCLSMDCYYQNSANAALAQDVANSINDVMQYVCILANQTGPSSVKGSAPGGTDAFPRPPPLDLSPTGGKNIKPDTFGAWYPSGYDAVPTNST